MERTKVSFDPIYFDLVLTKCIDEQSNRTGVFFAGGTDFGCYESKL